ncbi:MAG: 50S ribosome-binding protein YggL [Gammaproteobacteria bacterium]
MHDSSDPNNFIDKFVSEAIENKSLAIGGNPFSQGCFISMYTRGSVSEELRLFIESWIAQQPEVSSYWVGELTEKKP